MPGLHRWWRRVCKTLNVGDNSDVADVQYQQSAFRKINHYQNHQYKLYCITLSPTSLSPTLLSLKRVNFYLTVLLAPQLCWTHGNIPFGILLHLVHQKLNSFSRAMFLQSCFFQVNFNSLLRSISFRTVRTLLIRPYPGPERSMADCEQFGPLTMSRK